MDFSGTIEACDLKVGSCRQLTDFMKVCEYKGSMSFLYHIFPGFVYFVLYLAKISVERLQDHWSSGLAHLSQRLIGELIGYPWSGVWRPSSVVVVRPSTISNVFSSEIAWPIKAKFYMEPPWEGGTKVYINDQSHDQGGRHAHIW